MIKKWRFLLVVLLLSNALIVSAETKPAQDKKQKGKAVSLSLFIPGIHQFKTKQYAKGTLLLGSFAGCIAGALAYNKKGNDLYRQYQASIDVTEIGALRVRAEKSFRKRNLFFIGMFTVWASHVLDLKFFKKGKGGVKGEVGKDSINIGIYYSF